MFHDTDATFGVDASGVVVCTGAAEVLEDVNGDDDVADLDQCSLKP